MKIGTTSLALLSTGVVVFVFACGVGLRVKEMMRERQGQHQRKVARIQSLDEAFRASQARAVASGVLLMQAEKGEGTEPRQWFLDQAQALGMPAPAVALRETPKGFEGRAVCEATVTWAEVDPLLFQKVVEAAEAQEPVLRLRSAEVKARAGKKVSVAAVFETVR